MSRVPVLTYHSMRVEGGAYASNDHVALARDLELIHRLGLRIVTLKTIARAVIDGGLDRLEGAVGISFDDGPDFDWRDIHHPAHGFQRGFANILRDFAARTGRTDTHATAFVIVGPEARRELDQTCMAGAGWWNDDWWPYAASRGIAIENHSWDHNHATLERTMQREGAKGNFTAIDSYEECDLEIRQASDFIDARVGEGACSLFAYPYGEWNTYQAQTYLPTFGHEHRLIAAFTTGGEPVTPGSDRWTLPRYVCGDHWRSPEELEGILRGIG